MTREKESQVERTPPSVWSACVGVYASRRGRVCYYSRQPQWLHSSPSLRIGERLKPSFWCSAWVGNLNTKMHSIDSWPCKTFFNSLLFCFVLLWYFSPLFLSSKLFQILLVESKWSWQMVIFLYEIFFLARMEGSTGLYLCLLFFPIFSVLDLSVNGWWWLFEPWLRILIMTSRSGQRVYWDKFSVNMSIDFFFILALLVQLNLSVEF